MTVIDRLKMELNNKQYFTNEEYEVFLQENNLDAYATYDKSTMQRDLLWTCIDILEALSNDVDMMRKVETEFLTTGEAMEWIEKRIANIKQRIASIPTEEENSPFSLMFTRK